MQATFDNKTNLLSANIRSSVDNSILYSITTSHNLWGRTVTLLKDANPAPGDSPIVGAIYWRERLFMIHGHRKSIDDIKRRPPGFVHDPKPKSSQTAGKVQRTQSRVSRRDSVKVNRAPSRNRSGKAKAEDHPIKQSKSVMIPTATTASVPHCTSCFSLARRSSLILSQIGLGDWWRSLSCAARYWRWAADRTEYELSYHHEQWKALTILDKRNEDNEKVVPITGARVRYSSTSDRRNSRKSGHSSDYSESSKHKRSASHASSLPFASEKCPEDDLYDEKAKDEDEEDQRVAASLCIPYRNHLFHKTKPAVLRIGSSSLLQDEVFLILVFIYSETKRQDSTNSSGGW